MRRVLVVDDSRIHRAMVRAALTKHGFEVFEATSGEQALAVVPLHAPDLVLLDLLLPDMDGIAVLRELRRYGCEIPVLVITADQQEMTAHLLRTLGALDVLHKPIHLESLVEAVEGVLSVA